MERELPEVKSKKTRPASRRRVVEVPPVEQPCDLFADVDFDNPDIRQGLARAYAIVMRIKIPDDAVRRVEDVQTGE
jgi:hypothetical protein